MLIPAQLEHAPDRNLGAGAEIFGDNDLRREVLQAVAELFQRVHFHVAAIGAGAMVGGAVFILSDRQVWQFQTIRQNHPQRTPCELPNLKNSEDSANLFGSKQFSLVLKNRAAGI